MGNKIHQFYIWTNTFKGALFMAVFSLVAVATGIAVGNTFLVWANAACVLYWVWIARKALSSTATGTIQLTDDQMARVKEATKSLADTLKEIDLELAQMEREAKEQADVQSNQRENQEAGVEGIDGRADSKEDR